MKLSVDAMNAIVQTLRTDIDPTFEVQLNAEAEKLNSRWSQVVELCQRHKDKLMESLDTTERLGNELQSMSDWVRETREEHLEKEYAVDSLQELNDVAKTLQV